MMKPFFDWFQTLAFSVAFRESTWMFAVIEAALDAVRELQREPRSMRTFGLAARSSAFRFESTGDPEKRQKVLIPAVDEVNALSSHMVQIDAVRHGRKVVKLRLIWFAKDEQGAKAAYCEIQRHKAGRSARLAGSVSTSAWSISASASVFE